VAHELQLLQGLHGLHPVPQENPAVRLVPVIEVLSACLVLLMTPAPVALLNPSQTSHLMLRASQLPHVLGKNIQVTPSVGVGGIVGGHMIALTELIILLTAMTAMQLSGVIKVVSIPLALVKPFTPFKPLKVFKEFKVVINFFSICGFFFVIWFELLGSSSNVKYV
jgi:hypothetical protein